MKTCCDPQTQPQAQQHKPLIILVGWLGCQPKSLVRYAKLYQQDTMLGSSGCTVLETIPSPTMIVMAATSTRRATNTPNNETSATVTSTDSATSTSTYRLDKSPQGNVEIETMDDLAYNVLMQASHIPSSYILFHVFSNGGCFLWESIRDLLVEGKDPRFHVLQSKVCGIVFDSAPAYYTGHDHLLQNALKFCSDEEQQMKIENYIHGKISKEGKELFLQHSQQRALEYWNGLQNCTLSIPSLYICSKDDELTPFQELYDLIQYRKQTNNLGDKDRVVRCLILEHSAHCRHVLNHPQEYREAVRSFVIDCLETYRKKERYGASDVLIETQNMDKRGRMCCRSRL